MLIAVLNCGRCDWTIHSDFPLRIACPSSHVVSLDKRKEQTSGVFFLRNVRAVLVLWGMSLVKSQSWCFLQTSGGWPGDDVAGCDGGQQTDAPNDEEEHRKAEGTRVTERHHQRYRGGKQRTCAVRQTRKNNLRAQSHWTRKRKCKQMEPSAWCKWECSHKMQATSTEFACKFPCSRPVWIGPNSWCVAFEMWLKWVFGEISQIILPSCPLCWILAQM